MKKVSIWFNGFWSDFDYEDNLFINILRERYVVNVTDNNPDFLICSPLGNAFEWEKWDCPRIMFTGEYFAPEFYSIDYFIGYDHVKLQDRAMRFPLFLYDNQCNQKEKIMLSEEEAWKILNAKKYFCNYIFGHDTAFGVREQILHQLEKYKRVECAGTHLNNMRGGVRYSYHSKKDFMKQCKFTICAESVKYPGYTSEKIGHAYDTYTIPIYWGDPLVEEDFNGKSFVNCMAFDSIDDAIEEVISIDKNDDKYIKMLMERRYNDALYEEKKNEELKAFLYNIFDQEKEAAYRRPRYYCSEKMESYLRDYSNNRSPLTLKKELQLIHRIIRNKGL